jgi:hypothetical protein
MKMGPASAGKRMTGERTPAELGYFLVRRVRRLAVFFLPLALVFRFFAGMKLLL